MTAKHTPGPWTAEPTGPLDGWDGWSVEDANNQVVCDARGSQWDGVREANARLIAAAPELLSALEVLLEAHAVPSSICLSRPAYEAAKAAIAKATGTTKETT